MVSIGGVVSLLVAAIVAIGVQVEDSLGPIAAGFCIVILVFTLVGVALGVIAPWEDED